MSYQRENCCNLINEFLSELKELLPTDITAPENIHIEVHSSESGKNEITIVKISYDVNYKTLIKIIQNFKEVFRLNEDESGVTYQSSSHYFTWRDGSRVYIRMIEAKK